MTYRHFLTTPQVARVFRVNQSTVARWCLKGHLEADQIGTGRNAPRLFDHDTVIAFGEQLRAIDVARYGEVVT